jgi:uncharacterized protein YdaU (DUF1376 family)
MAKNTPAFQFYPSDFLGGTMMLTDAECGIYIKLLCSLWINKNLLPFCYDKLARCAMANVEEFEAAWPSIEDKFVVSDGTISHPRFTKMMELSEIRRETGSKGGFSKANNSSKTSSKTSSKRLASARRMKNEERSMNNEEETKDILAQPEKHNSDTDPDFSRFWEAFPRGRKTKRGKAYPVWLRAINEADPETIIAAAAEYAASDVGQGQYVMGPEPWLNGECWKDDREAWKNKTNGEKNGKPDASDRTRYEVPFQ